MIENINLVLLWLLSVLSFTIFIFSSKIIIKDKYSPIQFNWLNCSCIFLMTFCFTLLFNQYLPFKFIHSQYIIITLFLSSFLYCGLFFSKFHKLFLNIFNKKLYVHVNTICIYLSLFLMSIFIIKNNFITDKDFSNYIEYYKFLKLETIISYLFFIIPIFDLLTFFIMLLRKGNLLKTYVKLMYFTYVCQFIIILFISITQYSELLFFIFLLVSIIFNSLLIKNLYFDKGRYLKND